MPNEVGELEARVPSMAVTGLQRNVIAMAFCCKSDGGQHQGKLPPPKATQHRSYGRFITVLRRDWVVVAGAELQLSGAVFQYRNRPFHPRSISPYARLERFACLSFLNRLTVSPAIHHNEESTAPVSVSVTGLTGHPNALIVASSSLPRCHTVSPRW